MHKWIIAFMLGCLAGTVGAAGLEMVYPNGGESLVAGDTIAIKWKTGGITENVTLVLTQNGKYLANIIGNIKNSGSQQWQVGVCKGMTLTTGSGYVIKVRTVSGSTHDDTNGPFSIVPGANPPFQMVFLPNIIKLTYFRKPLNAKVKIQNFTFAMAGPGQLAFLEVTLTLQSDREWEIGDFGNADYGSQNVKCRIENPSWVQGPLTGVMEKEISTGVFSVRGGGGSAKFDSYPTQVFPKGGASYTLRFKPKLMEPLAGIRLARKMAQTFGSGSLCVKEYYPKIILYAEAWTEVPVSSYTNATDWRTFFMQNPQQPDWIPMTTINLPGETNLCVPGVQEY